MGKQKWLIGLEFWPLPWLSDSECYLKVVFWHLMEKYEASARGEWGLFWGAVILRGEGLILASSKAPSLKCGSRQNRQCHCSHAENTPLEVSFTGVTPRSNNTFFPSLYLDWLLPHYGTVIAKSGTEAPLHSRLATQTVNASLSEQADGRPAQISPGKVVLILS